LPQPQGIVSIRIDPDSGKRTSAENSKGIFEYFMMPYLPENEPAPVEEGYRRRNNNDNNDNGYYNDNYDNGGGDYNDESRLY
jgi:hypothetical protein